MVETRMVCHEGIVIEGGGGIFKVKIVARSACADCHAKAICAIPGRVEKTIDVRGSDDIQAGDRVNIVMEERMGWIALFYSFILPFLCLITILFVLYALGIGEVAAALAAVAGLVPYYLILYIFRKRVEKEFVFKAEKINKTMR
jgi:sigma-E factor negative regulatory protein RseC